MRASKGIGLGMAALVCMAMTPTLAQKAAKAGAGGKMTSEFEVSPLETRVLGQRNWLRGGPASLRVIVTNHMTGKPVKADVTILASPSLNGAISAYPISLYSGKTNSVGSLDAAFTSPSFEVGAFQLVVNVATAIGNDSVKELVQLHESSQLLLTCDKPLYQPGQVVHLRALALDVATRKAMANKPVTFEIEDARGNKVFKQRDKLSKFGVGAVDFQLADEVNMGTFTLRAILPEGQTEKKVRVERYVLPKFKIALSTDKPYYLPGEEVSGTLKANYFFGKPVAGGTVSVEINTVDIGVTKLTELKGKTDATGDYKFKYILPKSFVGQPFEQGKAVFELHATLKDTADHRQESRLSVPVVKEPILIVIVPESRSLVPGVENRVYIAAATPDGAALKDLTIEVTQATNGMKATKFDRTSTTDELGIASYSFTPAGKDPVFLTVRATDKAGRTSVSHQTLQASPTQEGVILRSDKTLAKVGDRINFTALSTSKGGTLFLDVIRNRQTILTHAQPMSKGESHLSLSVTPDMTGTLEIHAYKILPNEDIIRDTRTIIVSPADDLNIKIAADKGEYKPGGDASVKFSVTDKRGHPISSALGIAIVDESVFALSELQPGLERIYFTLEKELMEPKYEIHGLRPSNLLREDSHPHEIARQRAASLLLAAVPARSEFDIQINTFQKRFQEMEVKIIERMSQTHTKLINAVQKYRQDTQTSLTEADSLQRLVEKGYITEKELLDPWGNFYKTNLYGAKNYDGYFTLNSAGPDGKWNTNDDINEVTQNGFGGRRRGGIFKKDGIREEEMMFDGAALGGRGGLAPGNVRMLAMPMAARARNNDSKDTLSVASDKSSGASGEAAPRVREYFPETMLWNPALITDEKGNATLTFPMADSITTWRMSVMASSAAGQLGSSTSGIKVFQDFFADIDLPVSLTQNDRIEVPVAVYNYLPTSQKVELTLKEEPWFKLEGGAKQTLTIGAGEVKVVRFPLTASVIGRHKFEVTAKGDKLSDALRREIEVRPDGKEFITTINDNLEGKVAKSVNFPENAISGGNSLFVKLYPGAFSQVVEGLDGILRMPNGCFEQTSSTTYPNILVLDYLKQAKKINPELQLKAEQYINVGYQRLVTFECKNGGFSWFGNEPAHQILTAYGLLEFSDMSAVHEVDPNVISRTQNWLASQQNPDGTWIERNQGIAEGIINRQTGALRSTAYVCWALAESGFQGPQIATGVGYVKEHLNEAKDPYTLAVILNLLAKVEKDGNTTADVADRLTKLATVTDKSAYWQSETQTFTGANGKGADLETTGLAAYGLSKWGRNSGFTTKVLTYLVQSKDSFGTWESTQGTVWSMKALLFAGKNGSGGKGTVTIIANGQQAGIFKITPEDSDVMRQVSLAENLKTGDNDIKLQYDGDGSILYQIVSRHYLPWKQVAPVGPEFQPIKLSVEYDKKTLAQDDTATVTVKIMNVTNRIAEMPLIDLGVPPGFTVIPDELTNAVEKKTISKFTVAARQIIVYLEKLDPGQTVTLTYQVRAKFPIKAKTPVSKAYPYYNPEKVALSDPQEIIVK